MGKTLKIPTLVSPIASVGLRHLKAFARKISLYAFLSTHILTICDTPSQSMNMLAISPSRSLISFQHGSNSLHGQ